MTQTIILAGRSQRIYAHRMIDAAPAYAVVTIREKTRTDDQNRKLWPMLKDVSKQVEWYGEYLSKEDWKDVFTAALKEHQRVVRGIHGGMVFVGGRTSTMGVREFADLIELIYAFGAEHGVVWTEPKQEDAA